LGAVKKVEFHLLVLRSDYLLPDVMPFNSFIQRAITTSSLAIGAAWRPYTEPKSYFVAIILGLIAIGLILSARRMRGSIDLPHPGKAVKVVIVILWVFSILFFLGIIRIIDEKTHTPVSSGPILPITLASAAGTFLYLAYTTRKGGMSSAIGNGLVGAMAGPMIFEFPFDLIVIPLLSLKIRGLLLFFGPLFAVIFTTLALVLFSKRTSITKNSLYSLAAMLLVFAVWAIEGFSYPSNPVSFTLNAISKVLSFVTIIALFSTGSKSLQVDEKRPISE
jgi:hypothetical protein